MYTRKVAGHWSQLPAHLHCNQVRHSLYALRAGVATHQVCIVLNLVDGHHRYMILSLTDAACKLIKEIQVLLPSSRSKGALWYQQRVKRFIGAFKKEGACTRLENMPETP
jgi:hypothetical protein